MRFIKVVPLILAIAISLSGCDDDSNDPTAVGAKLPIGYTVLERKVFNVLGDCVESSRVTAKKDDVKTFVESDEGNGRYYIMLFMKDGSERMQVCIPTKDQKIVYNLLEKH